MNRTDTPTSTDSPPAILAAMLAVAVIVVAWALWTMLG
jgi:hypothetical protein